MMGLFMAVAVIGWFLADAGAHGQTTDALRVGADVWLVGHGSGLSVGGVPLGIVPLALTAMIAAVVYRYGRWAAVTSRRSTTTARSGSPRSCSPASTSSSPSSPVSSLGQDYAARAWAARSRFDAAGRCRGHARDGRRQRPAPIWVARVPGWVRSVAYGAAASFLLLLVASAVLVAVMVLLGLNQAASVMSGLHLSPGDYVMYTLATMAVAPNAVLFGGAYLLGPGFAVGTGTIVSPSVVSLGPVPAFPLLAALPDAGRPPSGRWVLAVPVVVGDGRGRVRPARLPGHVLRLRRPARLRLRVRRRPADHGRHRRRRGPDGHRPDGRHRRSAGRRLVSAVAAMSLGGLVAGVVTAWWQRGAARLDRAVD